MDILIIGSICGVLFYLYVKPTLNEKMTEPRIIGNKFNKLDTNTCSRDCCRHVQWQVPHLNQSENNNLVGSNLMCNGGTGGGCVCLNENEKTYLSNRADNGRDLF